MMNEFQKSAFKLPMRTAYIPVSQIVYSNHCDFETISTVNDSPNKKSICENTYLNNLNTNLSSSNLHNVHHVLSNKFCNGNNVITKSISLINNSNENLKSKVVKEHCNMIVQLGSIKSDNNEDLFNYTTGSGSSSSSGNSSSVDYKRRHHCTLPSITTTMSTFFEFF